VKKIFITILFTIALSVSANANEMISIEKYLSDKDPSDHAATTYSLIRCSGLELFFATIFQEKRPEAVKLLKRMSAEFALAASKLDSTISKRKFEDSSRNITKMSQEIMFNYINDGKKNWSKTGSYFLESYIDDDRLLCDYLYKSYIQK
jgi:hypothetical protein